MRLILLFIFLLGATAGQAGNEKVLSFALCYGGQEIQPGARAYPLAQGDSVVFETFRCYVSGIAFYKDGEKVFEEGESYHLLDAGRGAPMVIGIQMPTGVSYNSIGFNIGIDSVANTSGALGGALDPIHGMYWAWQSGYINLKLEGRSALCPTRRNMFQFHLGGYTQPNYALQRIVLPVTNTGDVHIALPLDKLMATIDLTKQHSIMMPCDEAVTLSKQVAALFEVR